MLGKPIATRDLKLSDVPDYRGDWIKRRGDQEDSSCVNFALSFAGDQFMRAETSRYIDLATKIQALHGLSPDVLKCFGITGLRWLLYIEQRHAKWGDATAISPYVRAIIEALKTRLTTQSAGAKD